MQLSKEMTLTEKKVRLATAFDIVCFWNRFGLTLEDQMFSKIFSRMVDDFMEQNTQKYKNNEVFRQSVDEMYQVFGKKFEHPSCPRNDLLKEMQAVSTESRLKRALNQISR